FQHTHHWLLAPAAGGDPSTLGLDAADHPLLGAMVALPETDGVAFTGLLSQATHGWLADHSTGGVVLFPGTGFLELAVRAGDQVGCGRVEELTLQSPLVLPERGGVRIQVVVGAADEAGRRPVTVYARSDSAEDLPWTPHATGTLTVGGPQPSHLAQDAEHSPWPPHGATPVDIEGLYDSLADAGLDYGPAFAGLRAAWRLGDDVFAEVALADDLHSDAERFGLHPALLDAGLHAIALSGAAGAQAKLPFSWSDVELYASGASALRVRVRPVRDGEVALEIADAAGLPVASVTSLALREAALERLSATGPAVHESLFQVRWHPVPADQAAGGTFSLGDWDMLPSDGPIPDAVVLRCGGGNDAATALAETHRALEAVQSWLSEERFAESTLAVVTSGAVAPAGGHVTDLAGAAVWGLVRSAQSEEPGRIVLADFDDGSGPDDTRAAVLALTRAGESQVAMRAGVMYAAQLARVAAEPRPDAAEPPPASFSPEGTVLVTGGTGGLGSLVARHLVTEYGVRSLLL
ncbi:polyketide synthase dehydratase domain-containing protein, partial [Streptomyces echinatus]|uniref:polyketide synthase dehydratase domain-containing protein n=1 Tax=Streptomyces echinatus TaxID=67293 RepID=UPI0037B77A75